MMREYDVYETKAAAEPDIVQAARMFDEARRELDMLQQQRNKLDIAAKEAQGRMNEAAAQLRALIDLPVAEAKVRREY